MVWSQFFIDNDMNNKGNLKLSAVMYYKPYIFFVTYEWAQ